MRQARVCYQIIASSFNTMKINLGMVEFHGASDPLTSRVESGKRNSILRQVVAELRASPTWAKC
jgi:hypothetical protein